MPLGVAPESGLIPFKKLLKIQSLLQPRLNLVSIAKRRKLYSAQDFTGYDKHMTQEFQSQINTSQLGYKILNEICGLQQSDI